MCRHVWPLGLLFALAVSAAALPGLPRIPGVEIRLPGLEDLLRDDDDPLTTSLEDATLELPWLDGWEPGPLQPGLDLPRDEAKRFVIDQPGCYEFDLESYCLRAGTHGPGKGDGYRHAVWSGPKAGLIRNILNRSIDHPDVPREDIQVLLWAIIARTNLPDCAPEVRRTADLLLTRDERKQLEGSAWSKLPRELLNRFYGRLPAPLREVYRAEERLRGAFSARRLPGYGELERIAVLAGDAPADDGPLVARGRWNVMRGGLYVRYFPDGYWRTSVQVYRPAKHTIERDALRRITKVSDEAGNYIATTYDDTIAPLEVDDYPGVRGYRFKTISYHRADGTEFVAENEGWTLVGRPGAEAAALPREGRFILVDGGDFPGWGDRFDQAKQNWDRANKVKDWVDQQNRPPSPDAIDDLTDIKHYEDGLDAAGKGSLYDKAEWIMDHTTINKRAWDYVNWRMMGGEDDDDSGGGDEDDDSGGDDSGGNNGRRWGPGNGGAMPGNRGSQRLGMSGRGAGR